MRKKQAPAIWPWILLAVILGFMGLAAVGLIAWWGRSAGPAAPQPTAHTQTATTVSPTLETVTPEPTAGAATLPPTKTNTPEPTSTATLLPSPTPEPKPLAVQMGSPVYTRAFSHTEEGCRWIGVAGQVFGPDDAAVNDVAVLVTGTLEGQPMEYAVVTTETSAYGPGGYEIQLSGELPEAPQEFLIQLYDLQSQPLSEPLVVRWPDRCNQNLVLVNFQSSSAAQRMFLPVTIR